MDELRKNNRLKIELKDKTTIYGVVLDYIQDRVLVSVDSNSVQDAKKINELSELYTTVETHFGIKEMISYAFCPMNNKNQLIIENAPTVYVEQKRKHVRVNTSFSMQVEDEKENMFEAKCLNISAGGLVFTLVNDEKFELEQNIIVKLPQNIFEKDLEIKGRIIKIDENDYVVNYCDIDKHDQDKIMKYVFTLTSKK